MVDALELTDTQTGVFALAVVALMFVMFLREMFATEVVALLGASILLATGVLPFDIAISTLSNPAPWTIATMFVIAGALVRTGSLDAMTRLAEREAERNPRRAIGAILVFVAAASAVVSNTPIVVVMIPVLVQLSGTLNRNASKLLIPLSYAAIVGGTLTLIGTSTNLLVDGVARSSGLEPFGVFELAPVGAVVVAWTFGYIYVAGPRLLPNRTSMGAMVSDRSTMRFISEAVIPPDSNLIGREVTGVKLFERDGVKLIDVIRGDASLRRDLSGVTLEVGDRVVLKTAMTELLSLQRRPELRRVDQVSAQEASTVEVLITPNCRMIGRSLGELRLRRRYAVYPLAVHRRDTNIESQIDDVVVRVGDTMLLEGVPDDIARLATDMNLVDISEPSERAHRRHRAPVAIAVLVGVVLLAALNAAPILLLAVIGMTVVLATGCVDPDEAFGFIDVRLLALIFAMLAVGAALESSGAVELVADRIAPALEPLPGFFVVLAVYLLSNLLTELASNNAVAVVMAPIAIGLAAALEVDSRPLLVAVMIAASASFATPIGYQTNTLVYGPGGYKFGDFVKFGVPLSLTLAPIVSLVIPVVFPL